MGHHPRHLKEPTCLPIASPRRAHSSTPRPPRSLGRWPSPPHFGRGKATVPEMQAALGIDWTDVHEELTEAIPPAYTRFLGEQLHAQITATRNAA